MELKSQDIITPYVIVRLDPRRATVRLRGCGEFLFFDTIDRHCRVLEILDPDEPCYWRTPNRAVRRPIAVCVPECAPLGSLQLAMADVRVSHTVDANL